MTKAFLRLPYTVSQVIEGEGGLMALIYPIDDELLIPVRGLSERFASFLEDHCHCRWCLKPIRGLSSHARCSANGRAAIWAVSPDPLKDWALALFKAELAHRLKLELMQEPDQLRGVFSPEQISGLLHAQSGRCFHCLHALVDGYSGQFRYEKGHCSALADDDEMDCTVLLCPVCSRLHGDGDVSTDRRMSVDELDATLRQAHKTMQARVRQFKRGKPVAVWQPAHDSEIAAA